MAQSTHDEYELCDPTVIRRTPREMSPSRHDKDMKEPAIIYNLLSVYFHLALYIARGQYNYIYCIIKRDDHVGV